MARAPFTYKRREPFNVLCVQAGCSLVRVGGNDLRTLREDVYDAAWDTNLRAKTGDIDGVYHTAMMGGEPYAVWR